jgi:CRP-like cAMP-binding protein
MLEEVPENKEGTPAEGTTEGHSESTTHRRANFRSDKHVAKRYIEINTLGKGKSFGDLALIGSKPRMASIRCLEDTHFAVLSKQDYNNVIGQIEKKKLNEKIQFLRSLPFFSQLTKTSVGKLTYQFKDVPMIKNQTLYREGDRADFIYIVKAGQFEVSKQLPNKVKPSH